MPDDARAETRFDAGSDDVMRRASSSATRRALIARFLGLGGAAILASARPAHALRRGAEARIAAIGGAVTEILYRLGAGARIVAVDTTSLHPEEALRQKKVVGYLRALSAEGLLSVGPDLVIASEGAGPPAVLDQLREAGLEIVVVEEATTAEGVLRKIATVGRHAGLEREAAALSSEVEARFAALARRRGRIGARARAIVVLSMANGRVVVGGRDTSADGILALAGIDNAASAIAGFKHMSDEAIVAAAPDAVVVMQAGAHRQDARTLFAPGTAVGQTPAAARQAMIAMDGLALLGFGPRTPETAEALMRGLYPDLPRE